jgi:tripartite-type tricarboxylate transporter receptor subunit TctC
MMVLWRWNMVRWVAALAIALTSHVALAQAFPSKALRMLVPYPPGGGTDIVARAIGVKLQESLGQPLVIENRPGASEIIATDALAKSALDDYTLGLVTNAFSINAGLNPKLPFDAANDFTPVGYLVSVPFMLVVHPSVPASSVSELVALAKAQPGKLNYASLGAGTPHGLAMEWFKKLAGVQIADVPYKGVAPAMTAVAAGEVQMMFTGLTAGAAQVKAGRLKALAVTPRQRVSAAPELPTIAEAGYTEFDVTTWYGVLAPAKTAPDIVAKLNAELGKALAAEDIRTRFTSVGVEPVAMSAAAFGEVIRRDMQLWAAVIRATGAKAE